MMIDDGDDDKEDLHATGFTMMMMMIDGWMMDDLVVAMMIDDGDDDKEDLHATGFTMMMMMIDDG